MKCHGFAVGLRFRVINYGIVHGNFYYEGVCRITTLILTIRIQGVKHVFSMQVVLDDTRRSDHVYFESGLNPDPIFTTHSDCSHFLHSKMLSLCHYVDKHLFISIFTLRGKKLNSNTTISVLLIYILLHLKFAFAYKQVCFRVSRFVSVCFYISIQRIHLQSQG